MRRLVITVFSVVVVFILFVVLCTFVRRPYEKILVVRFGSLIEEKDQTRMMGNWYFKYPTDSLVRIDTRLHLKALPLKEFNTAKKEPINVRAYVVWHIVDPMKFQQRASGSDENAEKIMEQRIIGLIGQSMGTHSLGDFFNTDAGTQERIRGIETEIAKSASAGSADGTTPGLTDIGIEIADIGFSRLAFPPANTEFVYGRMVADLNQKARGYESEGLKQANIIHSDGIAQAAKIRSEATAQAESIRGQADRESLEIVAKVASTDAQKEFYEYWKNLDFLKVSLARNTILVLSTDNPFIKRLFGATQTNFNPGPVMPTTQPGLGQILSPVQPASQGGK